ncbi:MAG: HAMP domain-containing protein [Armatimonadetes bacterium]|nr:HAMP domain-containing protein [Armatimonadota bacterium]
MFRSVFWRLVASQVLVALLAAVLAGALSYRLFRDYYMSAEEENVIRIGRAIADLAAPLLDEGDPRGEVGAIARAAGAAVGGRVCIFGRTEHELIAASAEGEGTELEEKPAIYEVLAGEITVERTSAECEPRHLLKVTVPINSARGPLGSVMVRVPVAGTEAILRSVRRLSLLTAAVVGALAFLLGLLVSQTIAGPLRRIADTSARIGDGEFAARVQPLPPGEIGELAATVNRMAEQLEGMFAELAREKSVLEQSIEQARRLETMRRSFVANASHQLRTPLTGARGFLEALADGTAATPEARERSVAVALRELRRMQTLIDRLLDLSRFDAGAVELEREPARVEGLVEGALAMFELRLREAGLRVETAIEPGLPELTVDGGRIVEALGNLLDNAVRVSPPGGRLVLGAARERDQLRLWVSDEGPGVPEAELESVWERFHSRARAGEPSNGLGLGLAIVREIVLAHGGEVFARNRPEAGAEFGFTLPTGV